MNGFGALAFEASEPGDQIVALGLAVAISMVFVFVAPFAWIPLAEIPLFLPLYDGALAINDLVTAAFFAALFVASGRSGLLFLTAGYLWMALLAVAHMLSFPGALTEIALLSGPQTTAWLYMAWHFGFPVAVILYTAAGSPVIRSRARALVIAGLAVVVTVAGLLALSIGGQGLLPAIVKGDQWKPPLIFAACGICLVAAIAIVRVLGGRTRLDLWLALILYARIGAILLSAVLNDERYDLGWYAGRFFGFIAASLVLYRVLQLMAVEHYHRARQ